MNKYELSLIINGKVDEEAKLANLEKVKGYIERFGGTIVNVDDWGKRRLAYEIAKVREGFFYFIQFESEPTAPIEIEKRVRIMENVLRYLIIKEEA
ncbi:30S ribosomal protein S6 [Anaerotalea alkaliphila]|uniref:Small ribosomal subunit protein bS6 n=1 Tax=Anaerotalea alkaliphila TaxID=2662126 RepID=A0A7X5HU96_9FIRM|nr:30S ribosomal protein S6 [Anaerotalea alkaliphila]NDL66685.1 30S ribosomal protein S6 [Anaerotalea alkaliphila]